MKKLMLWLGMLVFAGGCIPTTAEIQTLTSDVGKLMVAVDNYQEKFAEEVDRVQADIVVINEAVKEKADQGIIEQMVATNEASRPFNPYADEVNAILGLVTVIGGIWAKGEIDKKNKAEAKRHADKEGRELALREIAVMPDAEITAPIVKRLMYKAIGDARTRNKVA